MKVIPSKESRKEYSRRIKDFWVDFRRNRIGLIGLAILMGFILVAILAPWMTPYDPITDRDLAEPLAMPEWITLLPQNNALPRTMEPTVNWSTTQNSESVDVYENEELVVQYDGNGTEVDIYLTSSFLYPYSPPTSFVCVFRWSSEQIEEMGYSLELDLTREGSTSQQYSLWDSYYGYGTKESSIRLLTKEKSSLVRISALGVRERLGFVIGENVAERVFSEKGQYTLTMHVKFRPQSTNATAQIHLRDTSFKIPGLVHGILGTDRMGADLFSQLIYGIGISVLIGVITAVLATSIGAAVGVVSGYIGGAVDEALMRILDIMLCIPGLPLTIALISLFGRNIFYIVLLIALFTWTGLARVIRSQVFSLREMTFIETARAVGASKSYIIFKHILPNVFPVAFAFMVLSVPTAILTEASLSFLGLGDPNLVTWGRTISNAFDGGAFRVLAWWWLLPPGFAMTTLCLSFAAIGQALDEVMNPRLRRRR